MSKVENLEDTIRALKRNRFLAYYQPDIESATQLALGMIRDHETVGVSDSATLRQLELVQRLEKRGIRVINPWKRDLTQRFETDSSSVEEFRGLMRQTLDSDVYLTSTNAITRDGKLVYIDGVGNRIAGVIYSVSRSIVLASRNKVVSDVESAIDRIKNVISPEHARRRGRKVPCAKTLKCCDCNSPERQCNIIGIIEKKPKLSEISVIVIDQDLGLGWDPNWEEERIERIRRSYLNASWVFRSPMGIVKG